MSFWRRATAVALMCPGYGIRINFEKERDNCVGAATLTGGTDLWDLHQTAQCDLTTTRPGTMSTMRISRLHKEGGGFLI